MADEPEIKDQTNSAPTAEDYAALKAELETERTKAQELVDTATRDIQAKVTTLEAEIETKTADIEALKVNLKATQDDFEGAKAAYAYAVDDFKKLATSSNPLIPAEAVYGTTIEDVKASLERANALVGKVREAIAEQAKATPIPAGAPARTGADTEGLSTKEKINLGLEQAKRKKES